MTWYVLLCVYVCMFVYKCLVFVLFVFNLASSPFCILCMILRKMVTYIYIYIASFEPDIEVLKWQRVKRLFQIISSWNLAVELAEIICAPQVHRPVIPIVLMLTKFNCFLCCFCLGGQAANLCIFNANSGTKPCVKKELVLTPFVS